MFDRTDAHKIQSIKGLCKPHLKQRKNIYIRLNFQGKTASAKLARNMQLRHSLHVR